MCGKVQDDITGRPILLRRKGGILKVHINLTCQGGSSVAGLDADDSGELPLGTSGLVKLL
jgi:hypothetical protein